jgi:general secretion pathway protein A
VDHLMAVNRPKLIVGGSTEDNFPVEPGNVPLYEAFFGLRERPFDLVPNPRFLFLTEVQREVLSTLRYGLTGPGGITLLLGDAGTGKTTLVQAALASMGDGRVQCVLLSNPTLTRDEFYESLVAGFELGSEAKHSKASFLLALKLHAESRHAEGRMTAIMLDEAQSLPDELLEEVRLLSNMETSTAKLLNVVLSGQPELGARLNQQSLRQLKQRIGLRCALRPLSVSETASYLAGRLRIAGGSPADIFTREAVSAIYEVSGGIPRVVNVVAENALIGGFAAQVKPVPRAIIDEVTRDFDLRPGGGQAPPAVPVTTELPATEPAPAGSESRSDQNGVIPQVFGHKRSSFFQS